MRPGMLNGAGHCQNHVRSDRSSKSIRNAPICHRCGKPMKLAWKDSITETRQTWECRRCSLYRITGHLEVGAA